MTKKIKKIILVYSGGLDTSVMIPWLKENYEEAEIITVTVDVGQAEDLDAIKAKALKTGATKAYVEDVKDEFVADYLWPLVRSGALYEGQYILGTISRPLIAKKLIEVALKEKADAIAQVLQAKGMTKYGLNFRLNHWRRIFKSLLLGGDGKLNLAKMPLLMQRNIT
jgi:argininosuccinate synthase